MAFGCDLCSNLEDRKSIMIKSFLRVAFAWSASGRTISEAYTHKGQLQLKASDFGHCAVYEKELQRLWPITEENRKTKIAKFAEKRGFRLAYYKQGHCAIFLKDSTGHDIRTRENFRDGYSNRNQGDQHFRDANPHSNRLY
jgi:hypothetical protein